MIKIIKKDFCVTFKTTEHSAVIDSGHFGEMEILSSPIFYMRAKHLTDGVSIKISSASQWKKVKVSESSVGYTFIFCDPCQISGITVKISAEVTENAIYWSSSVTNESSEWSVMECSYPTLSVSAYSFNLFLPETSGIVIKDAGKTGYNYSGDPPYSMQFFAAYGDCDGLYFGIHDPYPALKKHETSAENGKATFLAYYVGENGNLPKNSFKLLGKCVWRHLCGDWFDAAHIYSEFVRNEATWLPKIDESGRCDTPTKFKEMPFWVCDYIPNSASQGDNRPMKLSAGSDIYTAGYWYNAVIELQKELGTPIGYHVYNWHEIPFNVNYPHFLPAKEEFKVGLSKLKEHDISVIPYINALSWETRDNFDGQFDVTFENTGKAGAVKLEDGEVSIAKYPQTHDDGKSVLLARMCPTYQKWHEIIKDVVCELESTLNIDGIYFDQIAAFSGMPCYDTSHGHTVGGGTYWCNGYRSLMQNIIKDKPRDSFYFSEDNSEEFINLFDGYLTWRWLMNEAVPAFPAVYSGYIQLFGRNVLGEKKDDVEFFKYTLAKSFLYGQQLGWIKADVLYYKEKLSFLKTIVRERYKYSKLFSCAEMLRPPTLKCSLSPKITKPAMHFTTPITMEQVYTGAWRKKDGKQTVIFLINTSNKSSKYSLLFNSDEYNLDKAMLKSRGFTVDSNGTAKKEGSIPGESIISFEF